MVTMIIEDPTSTSTPTSGECKVSEFCQMSFFGRNRPCEEGQVLVGIDVQFAHLNYIVLE